MAEVPVQRGGGGLATVSGCEATAVLEHCTLKGVSLRGDQQSCYSVLVTGR
jgi:hypothetical protein